MVSNGVLCFVLFVAFCSVFSPAAVTCAKHAADFGVSRTCHEMIVDQACRLHQRVADRCANEFESASLQIAAHRVGLGCARGPVGHASPAILDWFASDEAP